VLSLTKLNKRVKYAPLLAVFLWIADGRAAPENPLDINQDDGPITIDAEESVVCDEIARKCVAKGLAKAQKGTSIVYGDVLTVFFTEERKITAVTAEGHVRMETPTDTAYGEHAHYDMALDRVIMTGGNLRLVTPKETLTARDSIEYWRAKNQGMANGSAVMQFPEKKQLVQADKLVAYFVPSAGEANKTEVEKIEALGHVLASSPTDIVTGDKATYHAKSELVEVFGNVKINQGGNIIQGGYGRANLKTNLAEIFPSSQDECSVKKSGCTCPKKRISGIIIPKDLQKKEALPK